ncbi:acyl-CoA dehydrogenase [Rickettsiella endosymbiont of Aleochara curtula]|uniref:acyl-CoA dehydrogenase n=1 Tax=Rickettsiella endosymbiont of Aleochara curtula TaxID=3077936 RepID=UPI00313F0D61
MSIILSFGFFILVLIMLLCVTPLRQFFLVKPFLAYLSSILPPISETEKIVLEAGDMWWEKDLFRGRPNWKALHNISLSNLTREEEIFINDQVEKLCSMLNDFNILTVEHDLPISVWDFLKKHKFFGMVIPKKYEGLGFSALAHSSIVLKIATRSVSAAVNALVPNSLGPAELLLHYGTEEQKDYYLPRLARGEEIPCFALTSVDAGSDAAALKDNGIVCKGTYQDKETLGIRLNFNKRYITLAPIATVIGVAFKLSDPDQLLGGKKEIGITVALVPSSIAGVEIGKRHSPMGLAFMNGPIIGKNVFIPISFVIGGEKMLGQGWRMLMECLSIGRGISLPAVSAAQAQLAYRMTGAYSVLRQQFHLSIAHFEGVAAALARIAGLTYLIEATRRFTVTAVDASLKPALASAIAKYHMTEFARTIVNDAMDIHGGRGIQMGPRNYLAQGYIAIPISITVEGANILTRNLILFGQGAVRCHPYLRDEMQAVETKDISGLDKLLMQHFSYTIKNLFKTFLLAFGLGHFFVKTPIKRFSYYYRQISRLSAALALVTDFTLIILGGNLKRKERLSARLGDVLSYLYIASSVIRYVQEYPLSKEDDAYARWGLNYCLYHIQYSFEKFFNNFPKPLVAKLLKFIIFPLGRSYQLPTDKQDMQLVAVMAKIGKFRDRITQDCYLGKKPEDPTGRMEIAFNEFIKAQPIREKLKKQGLNRDLDIEQQLESALTKKILTHAEVEQFLKAQKFQQDAMQVDAF